MIEEFEINSKERSLVKLELAKIWAWSYETRFLQSGRESEVQWAFEWV